MTDAIEERLVDCFERVFPKLSRSTIPALTQASAGGVWDSIAQVTLLSLIGESFGIDIDFDEFEDAGSFAAILTVLRTKLS